MKLSVIIQEQEVHAAQEQLQARVHAEGRPPSRHRQSFRGGQVEVEVCYVERVNLWYVAERLDNRWANGFGFGDPAAVPMLKSVTWISVALDGSRQSAAGAFLRDTDGHTWLAHSGRVGGGKKAARKSEVLSAFSRSVETVDGYDYIVIGRIDGSDFLDKLADYVRAVQSLRASAGREEAGEDDAGERDDESDERNELTDTHWTRDAVFPSDDRMRRATVDWLGSAIRHAHAQSASCWAITWRNGPRLRLLVGNTVAFEIGRGKVGLGLHLPSISAPADAVADAEKGDFQYKSIEGGVLRWFSFESFIERRERLLPATMQLIELAASTFPKTPSSRFHEPELLHELEGLLGAPLPKPSFAGADDAPSYWKVSPGEKASQWLRCRDGGFIAIGWDELGDLTGKDRESFDARVDEALIKYPHWKRPGVAQAWRFLNIPVGARIVANDGTRRVVGIGTVTGPYHYVDDGSGFAHRLSVRWDDVRERVVEQPGWLRTIMQLPAATFLSIMDAPSPGEHRPDPPSPEAKPEKKLDFKGITAQLAAAGLRFPDEVVASYLLALQAKRFVILSGISGTGKTQLALAIARAFQPQGATTEVARALEAVPSRAHKIRVQPYMLKFRRLVVPAVLAVDLGDETSSSRVMVRFGEGQTESLRLSSAGTATQLLFKGKFREWFEQTFEPGDELELRMGGDDPLELTILPVAVPGESAAPQPTTSAVIAVRPDWTDNRGLLGYYNPITRDYHVTPFLRLLLEAAHEEARAIREDRPQLPFFAVLDEMNLARVEHYFSDFLSCLESGEPLHLHDDPRIAEGASETGEPVPMYLTIPRNLFFTGTVNVDETTYMFSPKVLDRAFVLEFNDVDLDTLGVGIRDDADRHASQLQLRNFEGALDIRDRPNAKDYVPFRSLADGMLHGALSSLNDRLQAEHRHFGYRVANEIARFVGLAKAQAGKHDEILWEAFDVAMVAKVLPKLHGTQQELENVLERLLAFAVDVASSIDAREHESRWTYSRGRLSPGSNGPPTPPKLPRAAAKLWRMLHRVRRQGYVSFIE